MVRTILIISFCLWFFTQISIAGPVHQELIEHIAPPFWWTNMKNPHLQILLHGENVAEYDITIRDKRIQLTGLKKVNNPNYLFLEVHIKENAKAGIIPILLKKGLKKHTIEYELKERRGFDKRIQGLNSSDFIYLIMPDRFSNGNSANDVVAGTQEVIINRDSMFYRHGGDIQGIRNHLDYIESLGVTALWLNPVLENNQPKASYHGYAATEHYKIDPRFGTMQDYLSLIDDLHSRDMKIVMDIIHNHLGNQHWLIQDLPDKDWIHQWKDFTRTSYRAPTIFDPYASTYDKEIMLEGWFDTHMPDLNQDNELLGTYLIQNNIWWIEYAGIDGFRMDTYAYSDPAFLEKWAKAIFNEYPNFGVFGETWVHGTPVQAYFHGQNKIDTRFRSQLPGLTDFQMYYAIKDALNQKFGWTEGVSRLYYTLAKDYLYEDASKNVLFLDNHDLSRFYSEVGEDFDKWKMGIGLLMTLRGIPCMYYGTEILMKNFADPDGKVREDFPGGWQGDKDNKFKSSGRTTEEQAAFDYIQKLAQYRKNTLTLQKGNLMQFIPQDGVYVFFRYSEETTVMVIVNSNDETHLLATQRYQERMSRFQSAIDIINKVTIKDLSTIEVPAKTTYILELRP